MAESLEVCYVSCACNRSPHSLDWSENGLICYGACNAVAIYDPKCKGGKVTNTLTGHKGRVNSVRWLKCNSLCPEKEELVSTSLDQTAIVWRRKGYDFIPTAVLKGHQSAVTVADGLHVQMQNTVVTIIVTTSVDSSVKVWERLSDNEEFSLAETIDFGSGLCLDVRLYALPSSNIPILACGADDTKIHLFVKEVTGYRKVHSLTGHEDWVRGLDFTTSDSGDVLLASCAQDSLIRLWCISQNAVQQTNTSDSDEIKLEEQIISVNCCNKTYRFSVILESVLAGHENWVYGVHWHPPVKTENGRHQPMELLSSSMDKMMLIWKPDPDSGVWLETVRVGEVGGNTLGFHGAKFSPDGKSILGHGFQGAFHLWQYDEDTKQWESGVTIGGHFEEVTDLQWEPGGDYVLSVSADQTTRLHGLWVRPDSKVLQSTLELVVIHLAGFQSLLAHQCLLADLLFLDCLLHHLPPLGFSCSSSGIQVKTVHSAAIGIPALPGSLPSRYHTWHELARPQIHGFDMNCIAILSRLHFASGGDEKVIRAFEAPQNFIENFSRISKVQMITEHKSNAQGASVPSLGLSNKAVYNDEEILSDDRHPKDQYPESYFVNVHLSEPPSEENLLQNTLWPEVQKLYGHGYEVFSLAASHKGFLLASACKATTAEHAAIILWDASTWQQIQKLQSHNLTVTQMAFSPDDRCLLSVSRDRRWSLFERIEDNEQNLGFTYQLVATTDNKCGIHSRIIWSCDWSPDSRYFATSSRDGKVVVWGKNEEKCATFPILGGYSSCSSPLNIAESVTAVAFAPVRTKLNVYLLAVGAESGNITLYKWHHELETESKAWESYMQLSQNIAHHLTVKRLRFRPVADNRQTNRLHLASCGSDNMVKLYSIPFACE